MERQDEGIVRFSIGLLGEMIAGQKDEHRTQTKVSLERFTALRLGKSVNPVAKAIYTVILINPQIHIFRKSLDTFLMPEVRYGVSTGVRNRMISSQLVSLHMPAYRTLIVRQGLRFLPQLVNTWQYPLSLNISRCLTT